MEDLTGFLKIISVPLSQTRLEEYPPCPALSLNTMKHRASSISFVEWKYEYMSECIKWMNEDLLGIFFLLWKISDSTKIKE